MEICDTHQNEKRYCECDRPFKLFFFPSEIRNAEEREIWVRAIKRRNPDYTSWKPENRDRIHDVNLTSHTRSQALNNN